MWAMALDIHIPDVDNEAVARDFKSSLPLSLVAFTTAARVFIRANIDHWPRNSDYIAFW